MKKLIVLLMAFVVAFVALSADYTPVTEEDSVVLDNDLTIDGKYAVTGSDATTGLMIQSATVTAVGTLETNTFAVAFGAAPIVMLTSEEATTAVDPWVGTVTASNFTCTVESSLNYSYVAVGARP